MSCKWDLNDIPKKMFLIFSIMAANDQAHIYNFYVQLGHINIKSSLKKIFFLQTSTLPKIECSKIMISKKIFFNFLNIVSIIYS